MAETADTPNALVLIGPGCPHCATVVDALVRLVKQGGLRRLEIVDAQQAPDVAQALGVRGLPWLRIGCFDFVGAMGYADIEAWASHAAAGTGWPEYDAYLLEHQRLDAVVAAVKRCPDRLRALVGLLADKDTPMGLRIGISAVVEEIAGTAPLRALVPELEELTLSGHAQVRADACHFLGLAGDHSAVPSVRRLLDDEHAEVREIASETLALLGSDSNGGGRTGP